MKNRQFIILCILIISWFAVVCLQNYDLAKRHDYIEYLLKWTYSDWYETYLKQWAIINMLQNLDK